MGQRKKDKIANRTLARHPGQGPHVPIATQQFQIQAQQFSGPIPPPALLGQYEEILPGMADRILQMAERQESHRHGIEKQAVTAEINRGYLGMASGFLVAICGLSIGGILLYGNKVVEGSVFAGVTLVSLVAVFVYGANKRSREREQKTRILAGK